MTATAPIVQVLLLTCGCEIEHEVEEQRGVYFVGDPYPEHGLVAARSPKEA